MENEIKQYLLDNPGVSSAQIQEAVYIATGDDEQVLQSIDTIADLIDENRIGFVLLI